MTLQQLKDRLDAYLAAELRILQSQEYRVGQGSTARSNRRADLQPIQEGIKTTRAEITRLEAAGQPSGRRMTYLRPL